MGERYEGGILDSVTWSGLGLGLGLVTTGKELGAMTLFGLVLRLEAFHCVCPK